MIDIYNIYIYGSLHVTALKDMLTILVVCYTAVQYSHITRYLFFIYSLFLLLRYLFGTSPTPTLYFVRSKNTICDLDRLLYRSPYYFYMRSRTRSAVPPVLRRVNIVHRHVFILMCFRVCGILSLLSACSIAARQLLYRLSLPLWLCTCIAVSTISLYRFLYDVSRNSGVLAQLSTSVPLATVSPVRPRVIIIGGSRMPFVWPSIVLYASITEPATPANSSHHALVPENVRG
jgi:hypothetical protein